MKSKLFKLNTTHVLILLGVIFMSSVLYIFLSATGTGRIEPFSSPSIAIEYYYINGCPYCVEFDPVWNTVSKKTEFANIEFKKLEISANKDRADKFNISSAPTIIAVRKNDNYKVASAPAESRTEAGFISFVKNYI